MCEKEDHYQNQSRCQGSRKGSSPAARFIHQRLGGAAAYGKTTPQACGEICGGQREKLLVGVESSPVLGAEHAPDGSRLDCPEQKARNGKRQ